MSSNHIVKFESRATISSEELYRAVWHGIRDNLDDYTVKDDQLFKKVFNRDDSYTLEEIPNNTISQYRFDKIKATKLVLENIKMALGIV